MSEILSGERSYPCATCGYPTPHLWDAREGLLRCTICLATQPEPSWSPNGTAPAPVPRQASFTGPTHVVTPPSAPWRSQLWSEFRDRAPSEQEWLVEGLLTPEALLFIAGPPKKGKTWQALALSISIATGRKLYGEYEIPEPRDVLYVALEGSKAGLRARIGAVARGMGLDPDSGDLDRLHMLYRPRPFDLAEIGAGEWLREEAKRVGARFVVVDVLRQAARINENSAADFGIVRQALEPLLRSSVVALLHHFGKLTESQKERDPGERMAGSGAMYGAMDIGFLITRSEDGARRLRIEVEARDFAAPDPIGVVIVGNGSGENGGFTYTDTATFALDATAAEERDLVAEVEALFADGEWRTVSEIVAVETERGQGGGSVSGIGANKNEVQAALESPRFVRLEDGSRVGRSKVAKPWGTVSMEAALREQGELDQGAGLVGLVPSESGVASRTRPTSPTFGGREDLGLVVGTGSAPRSSSDPAGVEGE